MTRAFSTSAIRWPSVASVHAAGGLYTIWNLLVVKQVKEDERGGELVPSAHTKDVEKRQREKLTPAGSLGGHFGLSITI